MSVAGSIALRTTGRAPCVSVPAGRRLMVLVKAVPLRSTTTTRVPTASAVKPACPVALIALARPAAMSERVCSVRGVVLSRSASVNRTTCSTDTVEAPTVKAATQTSPLTGVPDSERLCAAAATRLMLPTTTPAGLLTSACGVKALPFKLASTSALPSATALKPAGAPALNTAASWRAMPVRVSPACAL